MDINFQKTRRIELGAEEYLNVMVEFSEIVFHDFKNILSTISGLSQLSALNTNCSEVKDNLDTISQATFECRDTIDRFYSFIKGYNTFGIKKTSLSDIIFGISDMIKHRLNTPNGNEIKLNLNMESFGIFYCDEYKMKQAILNIVLNGIDAMEKTGGVLDINLYENSNKLILEVQDTGVGIPKDNLEKIFMPEFTTKGDRGTGLGLKISKNTISQCNGEIFVESKVGVGTKFTIVLPILDNNLIDIN